MTKKSKVMTFLQLHHHFNYVIFILFMKLNFQHCRFWLSLTLFVAVVYVFTTEKLRLYFNLIMYTEAGLQRFLFNLYTYTKKYGSAWDSN